MPRPKSDIEPRLVRAARARFLKDGVDGASLRQIARDAKTSIGMIYYYFPTKDDLFLAVVEEVYELLLSDLSEALDDTLPVEQRFKNLFQRLGSISQEELFTMQLILREVLVSSTRRERLVVRFMAGHVPLVLNTVLAGLVDGTLDQRRHPIVLMMSAFALAGPPQLIGRFARDRLPIPGLPSAERLTDELFSVFLHGVAGVKLREPAPEQTRAMAERTGQSPHEAENDKGSRT